MKWKDFFYYNKSQRRAVVFLVFALLVIFSAVVLVDSGREFSVSVSDRKEIDSLLLAMRIGERDLKKQKGYKVYAGDMGGRRYDSAGKRKGFYYGNNERYIRYRKNDSLRYDSLKRVWALEDSIRRDSLRKMMGVVVKFDEGTVVDINTADTAVLMKVPKIGSGISKMIVAYRNRLGGFYDVRQLYEVEFVDSAMIKWFKVDTGVFRKLKVNSDGIDVLRNHPYMDFYKAKAIVEFRRKRGKIEGLSQISMFEEFSEKDLERLKHYFSFE